MRHLPINELKYRLDSLIVKLRYKIVDPGVVKRKKGVKSTIIEILVLILISPIWILVARLLGAGDDVIGILMIVYALIYSGIMISMLRGLPDPTDWC
jgi:uncharacterized membrane protein